MEKRRVMTREMIAALNLNAGDQVRVTLNEPGVSEVDDIATLTRMDEDGDWWGEIEKDDEVCLTDVAAIEVWALVEPDDHGDHPDRP